MIRIARFFPDNFYDRSFREKLIGRGITWWLVSPPGVLGAAYFGGTHVVWQPAAAYSPSWVTFVTCPVSYLLLPLPAGWLFPSAKMRKSILACVCTCIRFFLYFCIFHVCICYPFCLLLPLSGCVYSPHGPPHRVTLTHLATLRLGVCHHQTKSLPGFRFLIQHI